MNEQQIVQYLIYGGDFQFFLEMFIPLLCIGIHNQKRKYFWIRVLGILVAAVPFYWLPIISLGPINFSYIITFAAIILASFLLYKEPPLVIALNAVASFGLQHLVWNSAGILFDLMVHIDAAERWSITLTYYLWDFFNYLVMAIAFYLSRIRLQYNRSRTIVSVIGIIILGITWILSQLVTRWDIYVRLYTFLATSLSLVCLFLFPSLLQQTEDSMRLRNENEVLEQLIEHQRIQNEESAQIREITRIHIHDLRHELDAIMSDADEEKRSYIANIRRDLDQYNAFATTGNESVDIILTEKSLLCNSKQIRFNYIVDGQALSFLKKAEMVALLGNIIDNAIEASEKEEDPYRIIKLNIQKRNYLLHLECNNYAHGIESFSLDNYASTKPSDNHLHGYGIKSIQYIVKRYGGSVDASLNEHVFSIEIAIPIPTK